MLELAIHIEYDQHDISLDKYSDEVERLLREYKQNQELVRRLGSRYYQVVYPIQVLWIVRLMITIYIYLDNNNDDDDDDDDDDKEEGASCLEP